MNLINTQEYSLSQLFSNPYRKIIIPDFQRDYCWGDKTHGENKTDIISGFLDTLIDEFNNNRYSDVLLGKIDVYQQPLNHIYLTDGQQRLTSLYLLLGMLYRIENNEEQKQKIKHCLITDYEEPHLQYAVRESTVFFLKDLILDFCLEKKSLLNDKYSNAKQEELINNEETLIAYTIKNQLWYFNEYNQDPSVISMLLTLSAIEKKKDALQVEGFSSFVLDKLKIQYYDVQSKKHGEERFVIINTTGKNLTVSENIKPILLANIQNIDFSKQWENRENYFWKNRNINENIADNGVNDFLTWCFQIIGQQDEINLIKQAKQRLKEKKNEQYLLEIQSLFNALNQLIKYLTDKKFQTQFQFINDNEEVKDIINLRNLSSEKQHNILLPLLSFISKFQDAKEETYLFLRRLRKNYFDFKWNDRNNNYVDWRYILQMIEGSNNIEQLLQFDITITPITLIQNINLNIWFNEEEKIKLKLYTHRVNIEHWEDHESFMGDLSFLFKVHAVNMDNTVTPIINSDMPIDFENLKREFNNYQSIIGLISNCENAIQNIPLANMFRLFRLFIGCNKVGHIYKTTRGQFEGVLFSNLNREHFSKIEFLKLLKNTDLLTSCITFIKNRIKEDDIFNLEIFTVDKFIKAWLTLKVFYANEKNTILSFYDANDTGVSAYIDKDRNRLVNTEEFSLSNSICGFAVRSGFGAGNYVHYTNDTLWCNADIIDTPFSAIAYKEKDRTLEQIKQNNDTINYIINTLIG